MGPELLYECRRIMSDSLTQVLETTMTTDRTGSNNKDRAQSKDNESHTPHESTLPDHASRNMPEGEVLEDSETRTTEADTKRKNGQERDDKKVVSFRNNCRINIATSIMRYDAVGVGKFKNMYFVERFSVV